MFNIGSKWVAEGSLPLSLAARDTGDGAKLANWGRGEKEKLGLYGMARLEAVVLGTVRAMSFGGGVKGGIKDGFDAVILVSLGLWFEFGSDWPASEGLVLRIAGGWVAEVGVGNGGGYVCVDVFLVMVGLRLFLGRLSAYCEGCDGTDGCW
jgi:hypothetical protein